MERGPRGTLCLLSDTCSQPWETDCTGVCCNQLGRIICNTLFLSYSAATMGSAWMGLFLYTWFIRVGIFRDFTIWLDSNSGCHNLIPKQLFTYIFFTPYFFFCTCIYIFATLHSNQNWSFYMLAFSDWNLWITVLQLKKNYLIKA